MTDVSRADSYDRYIRAEWALFAGEPSRAAAARRAVDGFSIARVLDIGCGAGQELRPFLNDSGTFGVGIDLAPEVGRAGRQLFAADQPRSRVGFVRAAAESLPFGPSSFDLVICRLALPYTDNARALGEMARVLQPGGALLLTFHHARYYARELRQALSARRIKPVIHASRVLVAGALYHLVGSQPRSRLSGGETFQTMWLLRRELSRHRLEIRRVLAGSVPAAPSLLIVRRTSAWPL
jgi:ubiquinone/menaquinone biosynthesis C-methylase UbiE